MTGDFRPGDRIERLARDGTPIAEYEVLDPVRTTCGKLRLRGPRGGYLTAWWRPGSIGGSSNRYRLKGEDVTIRPGSAAT